MSDEDDPASRMRATLLLGIGAIEKRMAELTKGKATKKDSAEIVSLTKDAATVLSHIRRYDQAMREAGRALTPAVVIAYLRALSPAQLRPILAEVSGEDPDEGAEENVLS